MESDAHLPRIGRPSFLATDRRASRTAAAPSETCDALPAWVVPVLEKAGLSLDSDSAVTPSRMPSSAVTVRSFSSSVFGSVHLTLTGTISRWNWPAFCALTALANDSAAKRSCSSRVMPYSEATFSLQSERKCEDEHEPGNAHRQQAVGRLLVLADRVRHLLGPAPSARQ